MPSRIRPPVTPSGEYGINPPETPTVEGGHGIPRPVGRRRPSNDQLRFVISLAIELGDGGRFTREDVRQLNRAFRRKPSIDLGNDLRLFRIEKGIAYVKKDGRWLGVDVTGSLDDLQP